jgi:MFS transporter, DHA3 family, macrolide efflux protein
MLPKVLRHKNYRRLYIAAFTSELGLFISETALFLYVFDLSGEKKSVLGLSRLTFLLFLIGGSLLGGIIGSKRNRKSVLIACEALRIPIVATILLTQNPYLIIFLSGLKSFFSGVFNPNRQTLINEIVPSDDIERANGLFSATTAILMIVGPLLGAFFYTHFQGVKEVLIFDLLTYILGIILLSRVNYKYIADKMKSKAISFKDFKETHYLIAARADLRALFTNSATAGLCIGVLVPLLVPFTTEILGKTKQDYGTLMALFGVGGIIGGVLSKKLREMFSLGKVLISILVLECLCFLIFSLNQNFTVAIIIFFLWGILVFSRLPNQLNYLSASIETKDLSRVLSISELSFVVPNLLSSLFIMFFADKFTVDSVLLSTALLFLLLIVLRIKSESMRCLYYGPSVLVKRETQA